MVYMKLFPFTRRRMADSGVLSVWSSIWRALPEVWQRSSLQIHLKHPVGVYWWMRSSQPIPLKYRPLPCVYSSHARRCAARAGFSGKRLTDRFYDDDAAESAG